MPRGRRAIPADESEIKMNSKTQRLLQYAAATVMVATLGIAAAPQTVMAKSTVATALGQSVSAKVTVKSIDAANRRLVVTSPSGEVFSIKAPPSVRNFSKIKVGDTIRATYTRETEIVISTPNSTLPSDTQAMVAARAAKGQLPAAVVANGVVVSGAVLAIDMAHHTLKIVSPQGGEVHTITVKSADRQKAMSKLKVGDTITAYITESLLIAVNPA
jgi:hypothetical protein